LEMDRRRPGDRRSLSGRALARRSRARRPFSADHRARDARRLHGDSTRRRRRPRASRGHRRTEDSAACSFR
jgi:hypothetical protein